MKTSTLVLTGAYTALSLIVILVSVYLYGPNDFALPFVTTGPIVLQAIVLVENIHNATFLPFLMWFMMGNALNIYASCAWVSGDWIPSLIPFAWAMTYTVITPFHRWYDRIRVL
jgi:hypothetical protein